jgi:hypothetical protein
MIKDEFSFIKKLQKSGDIAIRTKQNDVQDCRSVAAGGDCLAASGKYNYRNIEGVYFPLTPDSPTDTPVMCL